MKHNNVIPNGHFKKHWQNYVKTWFNQPARKQKRRIGELIFYSTSLLKYNVSLFAAATTLNYVHLMGDQLGFSCNSEAVVS
jgi:hypothetical protein